MRFSRDRGITPLMDFSDERMKSSYSCALSLISSDPKTYPISGNSGNLPRRVIPRATPWLYQVSTSFGTSAGSLCCKLRSCTGWAGIESIDTSSCLSNRGHQAPLFSFQPYIRRAGMLGRLGSGRRTGSTYIAANSYEGKSASCQALQQATQNFQPQSTKTD